MKSWLSFVACAIAFTFTCIPVQPIQAEETESTASIIEEVLVTGSRIRRDAGESSGAIQNLSAEYIEGSGQTSLGDMLSKLTLSGSPLTTKMNRSGNFGFPPDGGGIGAGSSQVDLRHLGAKRVLVLVNGQRWVHGSSGSGVSGATDLNTIPLGAIERIEVLRDGASAIYGSDAIAGVVNVVTKTPTKDEQSLRVFAGSYANGGMTKSLDANLGMQFTNTNVGVNFGFTDQALIGSAEHPQTAYPFPNASTIVHGSTFTPQGRVVFTDPNTGKGVNCALNEGVVGIPRYDPADPCGSGDDYHPWTNADRFNYASFNLTLTPSRRLSLFSTIEHRFSDSIEASVHYLYNRRKSQNRAAPEPLWLGPLAALGGYLDQVVVATDNPYNPFGFDVGNSPNSLATRRPLESGPRIFEQTVDTFYLSSTLRGAFTTFDRTFDWDANLVHSTNEANQTKRNSHNARKIMIALGDPQVCEATPGCTPLNFFGGLGNGEGTITDSMLNWIRLVEHDFSNQTLRDYSFNITGDLYENIGSLISFAAGIEHREQSGKYEPDPNVAAGETAGAAAQPTKGSHDTLEYYAEVESSVLARDAEIDKVSVALAVRGFNYSTFGSGSTFKVGMRWRTTSHMSFHANFAEGFRVPNIGELFGGLTQYAAVITDPCSALEPDEVSEQIGRNCIAAGVPEDGSYRQLGSQMLVQTGGNSSLEPETSQSTTIQMVYEIPAVDDLVGATRFELGYYDIELEDTITAFDAQNILDGCYVGGINAYCAFIDRSPQGGIASFKNTLFNVGSVSTDGWDIAFVLDDITTQYGLFDVDVRFTRIRSFTETTRNELGSTLTRRQLLGRSQNDHGIPKLKGSMSVDWSIRNLNARWSLRYLGDLEERCSNFLDDSPDSFTSLGLCAKPNLEDNSRSLNVLKKTIYNDVQGTYDFSLRWSDVSVSIGINNVFDVDPPPSYSATLNGYDASTYEFPGSRFIYAALNLVVK